MNTNAIGAIVEQDLNEREEIVSRLQRFLGEREEEKKLNALREEIKTMSDGSKIALKEIFAECKEEIKTQSEQIDFLIEQNERDKELAKMDLIAEMLFDTYEESETEDDFETWISHWVSLMIDCYNSEQD